MTVSITLTDSRGNVALDRVFDQPFVTIGGGPDDDFIVREMPVSALQVVVTAGGGHIESNNGQRTTLDFDQAAVVEVGDRKLRICVSAKARRATPDGCPRCGGRLQDRASGGAYRTMVARERSCAACSITVLEMESAETTLGAFAELHEAGWLTVSVPMHCPRCAEPLSRTALRTAYGTAQVERCAPCALVVLDAKDLAVLGTDN